MAFDLTKVFSSSGAVSLKKTATKIVTWIKKNPLKALGIAVGVLVGVAAIWFLAPLAVAGVTAFLSASLLVQVGVLLTISALFTFVLTTATILWNFNWLVSDDEIEKEIKSSQEGLYGMAGELVGQSLGFVVGGALPGAFTFLFNKHMAAAIFENLTEEAQEELGGQLAALMRATFRSFGTALIKRQFKSARKYLKKNPNHPLSKIIRERMGEKRFREWGEKDGQSFTISNHVEERVENIKDPRLRNFTENFLEGFGEAMQEAGYIVANSADTFMATQAMMNRRQAGIDPDENVVVAQVS